MGKRRLGVLDVTMMDLFPRDGVEMGQWLKIPWKHEYYSYVAELKDMELPPPMAEMQRQLERYEDQAEKNFLQLFRMFYGDDGGNENVKKVNIIMVARNIEEAGDALQALCTLSPKKFDINCAVYIVDQACDPFI